MSKSPKATPLLALCLVDTVCSKTKHECVILFPC